MERNIATVKNGKLINTNMFGTEVYEIVNFIPNGYVIWNIGKNIIDGYLPLCRVIPGTYSVETETLRAIRLPNAQEILSQIGYSSKRDKEILDKLKSEIN